jgi:DNA-binding transcriptional MocR family regulator
LSAVFDHVHRTRGARRSELALATGLSRSTIKALVEELIARGLVIEHQGRAGGGVGRPSPFVVPRGDAVNVLAIEIAVDAVSAAIASAGGAMERVARIPRPASGVGPRPTVRLVRELVQPLAVEIEARGATRRSQRWAFPSTASSTRAQVSCVLRRTCAGVTSRSQT